MGLAISDNQRAVYSIGKIGSVTEATVYRRPGVDNDPSCDPRQAARLCLPLQLRWRTPWANARLLTLSLANPAAQTGIAGLDQAAFVVHMEARFDSDTKAVDMESQLVRATNLVKTMVETRQAPAGPTDLASILMRGTFQNASGLVTGSWPVSREFVNSLLR